MNENEIYEILESYRQALDFLVEKVDGIVQENMAMKEQLGGLEQVLYEGILSPAKEAIDSAEREDRFEDFNSKYGEQLGGYNGQLAPLEGEDFDLTRTAFDNYDSIPDEEKPDSDEYVNALIAQVDEQINSIKEALGLPADTEVEVKQDENGNTEISADGEPIASDKGESEGETEGESEEKPEEGEKEEEKEVEEKPEEEGEKEEEEKVDDPEEIAALEEELKGYLK